LAFIDPMTDITIISLFLIVITRFIQGKFIDRDKMESDRKIMGEKRKKMMEISKKKDKQSIKELKKMEEEILQMSSTMMQGTMRYMMYSLPLFLVVFGFLGASYGEAIIDLPVALPWFGGEGFLGMQMYEQTNWFGWYFVSYLSISIVLGIAKKIRKNIPGGSK